MVVIARPSTISWRDSASVLPPNVSPIVPIAAQAATITPIQDWIETGTSGLAILTGAPGSGKSRMLEHLVLALAENEDRLIGVIPAGVGKSSDAAFLRQAIEAFGGSAKGRTGLELIAGFRALLAEHRQDAVPAALLIDDAAFGGSRLEILRSMLVADPANPGDQPPRLQMVLFGAPDMADRINRRQGLSAMAGESRRLPPLSPGDLERLVLGWHAVASKASLAPFPDVPGDVLATIVTAAEGNPGRALSIAEQAVHDALRMGSPEVSRMMAQSAIDGGDSGSRQRSRRSKEARHEDRDVVQTALELPGLERPATEEVST